MHKRHPRGLGGWGLRKADGEWAAFYRRQAGILAVQQMAG